MKVPIDLSTIDMNVTLDKSKRVRYSQNNASIFQLERGAKPESSARDGKPETSKKPIPNLKLKPSEISDKVNISRWQTFSRTGRNLTEESSFSVNGPGLPQMNYQFKKSQLKHVEDGKES